MSLEQASKDFAAALLALATAVAESVTPATKKSGGKKADAETPKTETPKVEGPSAKQVADAVLDLANNKSRDVAVAILTKFKAGRVSELKPENYAAVMALVAEANAAPAVVSNDSLV